MNVDDDSMDVERNPSTTYIISENIKSIKSSTNFSPHKDKGHTRRRRSKAKQSKNYLRIKSNNSLSHVDDGDNDDDDE